MLLNAGPIATGVGAIVKYSFTLNNTGGPTLATDDMIFAAIALNSSSRAGNISGLTCTSGANNVTVSPSAGNDTLGSAVAAGATVLCTFTTTVGANDYTAVAIPRYKVDVTHTCGSCGAGGAAVTTPTALALTAYFDAVPVVAVQPPQVTVGRPSAVVVNSSPVSTYMTSADPGGCYLQHHVW